jgi:hypothetical protein
MSWETVAAISQVLAAIGVIVSVLYLARQIRDENRERRRTAVNVLVGQWNGIVKSFVESEEFCDLYLRGIKNFDQLSPAEKVRLGAFFGTHFKNFDGMYRSRLDGTLEPSHWEVIERMITDLISYPGTQQWWAVRRHWHTAEFASVVDQIISRRPTAGAYDHFFGNPDNHQDKAQVSAPNQSLQRTAPRSDA